MLKDGRQHQMASCNLDQKPKRRSLYITEPKPLKCAFVSNAGWLQNYPKYWA